MYTIKEASARTGVPVALLRAWERRYGVVAPSRSSGGYRLYDEVALDRIRAMRRLVDGGWSPSVAAAAIVSGEVDASAASAGGFGTADGPAGELRGESLVEEFVDAAITLDPARVEAALDRIFAAGTFEAIADRVLLPALIGIGDAWADGRLGVAGEHAASHAVLRRLSAAFQAAGQPDRPTGSILVGLPPGSRHELAALAFSVAARRAGLPVVYLGPDLPPSEWVVFTRQVHPRAAVIGSPTRSDVVGARQVAEAIQSADPAVVIAFGGRYAAKAATDGTNERAVVLPDGLAPAVAALRAALGESAPDAAG